MIRLVAWAATLLFAVAVAAFAARFPQYLHAAHPVGMLGATAVPGATAFNLLAWCLPGVLVAGLAWRWRSALSGARWTARLGAQAWLLSAVAFAAQGLFVLDSYDLDARSSRLHGAAWTLWWLAFAVGALLSLHGLRGHVLQGAGRWIAACAAACVLAALAGPVAMPVGITQRVAYGAWFLAALLAAGALSRNAASARGSSPTVRT